MHAHCRPQLTLVTILIWTLVTLCPFTGDAVESPVREAAEKLTIAYSSISGTMAPVWVTYEVGLFRKYGLDVDLVYVGGGSKAVKSLISGDVDVAQVGGAAVIKSNLKGSEVVMIAGVVNTMPYQFIVEKDITRPDQLKGKAVAVSRYGGSSDFATRYAIEKFGLVPEKDVAILEIGSQPARLAALQEGKVQGVMLSIPKTREAKKMGFSALADLRMLGLEYQHTGLATTKALIDARPDLLSNVMKAYVEGIHYYKTHRVEALKILQKYLKTDDMEALNETYDGLALALLPEKPYPTLQGIQTMLRRLARKKKYAKAKTAQAEKFVNTNFVKELDRSGFIDRLYKATPTVATVVEQPVVPTPETPPEPVKEEAKPPPAVAELVPVPPQMPDKEEAKPAPTVARLVPVPPQMPVKEETPKVSEPVLPSSVPDAAWEYTVKAGDTLSHLAHRYYRNAIKWPIIYEANRETIKNPDYIYIGQEIMIPPDKSHATVSHKVSTTAALQGQ